MKRVAMAVVSTVAALVMLLSFKTHGTAAVPTPPSAVSSAGTSSNAASGSGSTSNGSSSTTTTTTKKKSKTSTGSSTTAAKSATYTGTAAETRYGPVQVQITVKNGAVTAVAAVDYPTSDPRDAQINSYAIPALNSEAASANSASIDMISGATFTSEGYIASLQSALDQAGL